MAALEELFRDFDILLCASSMDRSSRIKETRRKQLAPIRVRRALCRSTWAGHPALAMMAGLSSNRRNCRCRCSSSAGISTMRDGARVAAAA